MRRRLATTLVLGAGVPILVLSYLAMGSIEKQRSEDERTAEDRANLGAATVAERLDSLLEHAEATLGRWLGFLPFFNGPPSWVPVMNIWPKPSTIRTKSVIAGE